MAKTGETWNFTYNTDGLRTSRSNGTTTYNYVYNNGQLRTMTVNGQPIILRYGADGKPYSLRYAGVDYLYILNAQGDVIGIADQAGAAVVSYAYDAWGNILSTSGSSASTLGQLNPLRYRGYVYDSETGLYYLKSRYYNAEIGRFISPDNYPTTGQDFTGNNMFAYCGNNPVSRADEEGEFWNWVIGATVGALVEAISTAVEAYKEDGWDAFSSAETWAKIGVSAACGTVNGLVAASGAHYVTGGYISGLTGAVESMAHQLIDNGGDFSQVNGMEVFADFTVGMIGGAAGGNGAIRGNKYMAYQKKSFIKHKTSNGLQNGVSFYYKMTANYSKQFIKPTIRGIFRGFTAGLLADQVFSNSY